MLALSIYSQTGIPKRFHCDMSSGRIPAPNKNIPNTKNTTPIWSIPMLVTT